jgi:hypothetical protein
VALQVADDQSTHSCVLQANDSGGSSAKQLPPGTNRCVAYIRTCPAHSGVDCIFTSMHLKPYAALQAKDAGGPGAEQLPRKSIVCV